MICMSKGRKRKWYRCAGWACRIIGRAYRIIRARRVHTNSRSHRCGGSDRRKFAIARHAARRARGRRDRSPLGCGRPGAPGGAVQMMVRRRRCGDHQPMLRYTICSYRIIAGQGVVDDPGVCAVAGRAGGAPGARDCAMRDKGRRSAPASEVGVV